jgi:hypothetical protein
MHTTCQFSWPRDTFAMTISATPRIIAAGWTFANLSGAPRDEFPNEIAKDRLWVVARGGTLDDRR